MRISEVARRLTTILGDDQPEPVLLVGQPGVGKSALLDQVSSDLGYRLIISHPVTADQTDYKGQPAIVDGQAEFLPFGDLRSLITATQPTVCFLDDVGQAALSVQAALMQLVWARRVNGHRVADCVRFVLATNRRTDKSAVSGMVLALVNRCTVLNVDVNVEDWRQWAMNAGVPLEVVAYVSFEPAALTDYVPTSDIANVCTPRTLELAGRNIRRGFTDCETLAGCIGTGRGAALAAFIPMFNAMPSIDAILANPAKAAIPAKLEVLCAVCVALAARAGLKTAAAILTFAKRLAEGGRPEHSAMLVLDAYRRDKAAMTSVPEFGQWALANPAVLGQMGGAL